MRRKISLRNQARQGWQPPPREHNPLFDEGVSLLARNLHVDAVHRRGGALVRNTGCKVTPHHRAKGCSFFGHMRAYPVLDPGLHRRVSSTPSRSTLRGRPSAAIFLVIYRPLARGSFTYRFERLSFFLCWWHTRVSQRFAVQLPSPSPFHAWTVDPSLQFSCPPRVRRYYNIILSYGIAGLIVEDWYSLRFHWVFEELREELLKKQRAFSILLFYP